MLPLRRVAAFVLDYLLIAAYLVLLTAAQFLVSSFAPGGLLNVVWRAPLTAEAAGFVLLTLPVILYFAISEASARQGTFGKHALHLAVTDEAGRRISLLRALARSALKFTPWEMAHALIFQIAFRGPSAGESPAVLAGFAIVYLLVAAYLITLFVGSQRTLYDRSREPG